MPPTVTLRAFADDEYGPWRAAQIVTFAEVLAGVEGRPAEHLWDSSAQRFDRLMPNGLAAEGIVRDAGLPVLGLNVFGDTTTARRLYDSLGYRVDAQQMSKAVRESG